MSRNKWWQLLLEPLVSFFSLVCVSCFYQPTNGFHCFLGSELLVTSSANTRQTAPTHTCTILRLHPVQMDVRLFYWSWGDNEGHQKTQGSTYVHIPTTSPLTPLKTGKMSNKNAKPITDNPWSDGSCTSTKHPLHAFKPLLAGWIASANRQQHPWTTMNDTLPGPSLTNNCSWGGSWVEPTMLTEPHTFTNRCEDGTPNYCHNPLLVGWKGVLCEEYGWPGATAAAGRTEGWGLGEQQ